VRTRGQLGRGAHRSPPRIAPTDAWFRDHVIGGPAAFAQGYDDFGRAFRQKFVSEISER
jgi:hypothetical protein